MQYFLLMDVHLEPVKALALSVTVLRGAPIDLITSSYASGAWLSLLIKWTFTSFVFLKANNWKHLNPLMEQSEEKKVSENILSSILMGFSAHALVL